MYLRLSSKYKTIDELQKLKLEWNDEGLKCVFTNGCFDILHEGHVRYLEEARLLGDKLIVGINGDQSVRRLKGPTRPINFQQSRAIVLSALQSVDAVIIFEEDTPENLIQKINPEVLVKGGDWKVDQIVGADHVLNMGGQVFSLTFHQGFSTSLIVQKMKSEK
ncbi:MAG: D-glycero-beta-D-manno-heptose 1-phosphate adenylyltransferase [Saprospiraceae bacterium]|nr:D-glycero-beta-D-manno-heptose 1-phosphate adenylyltransferase [Saprospiraceae bacterium]